MIKNVCIFLFGACLTINGFASFIETSNNLKYYCNSAVKIDDNNGIAPDFYKMAEEHEEAGLCYGYISSVTDVFETTKSFCLPYGVTTGQLARIFVKYVDDNPTQLNQKATISIVNILHQDYPCR